MYRSSCRTNWIRRALHQRECIPAWLWPFNSYIISLTYPALPYPTLFLYHPRKFIFYATTTRLTLTFRRNHASRRNFSEMSKVNNTLNAFVGGKQKSWMRNRNAILTPGGIPVQTTIRSQMIPIKRKTTLQNRQCSIGGSARNSIIINGDGEPPPSATMGPGKSPPLTAPSSLSPDLRCSGLSPKRRVPAGSTETVLPSPAPSDTPSVADRREDEDEVVVTTLAAARDTPIASPAVAGDNEDDQRYGDRQDERGAAVDTRDNQTELSSGIAGSVDANGAEEEQQQQQQQRVSAKRGLETVDERPENPKRQRQSSSLPPSDQTDVDTSSLTRNSVPRPGEQGSGTGLSNRAQSPVVIDSRQTSPTYNQPNVPISQKQTPTNPSNVSPVTGHSRAAVGPSSGGNNPPLPLLYSTSLPFATSSPLAQSPMLANTPPSYGSPNTVFPGLPSDQNTWIPQGITSPYHGMPSPGVLRNQQQQLLQEQPQPPPRRPPPPPPPPPPHQLPGPEYLTKLTTHLPRFDQYIHTEGGADLRQFNSVECFRFKILREAITNDDWFFTILNQVYALVSTAEEALHRETGISASLPGFGALPDILHDNQRLSGRNLMFLAAFPVPVAEAKLRLSFFPALLRQVKDFLTTGYKVCSFRFSPARANLLISQLTTTGHSKYEISLFQAGKGSNRGGDRAGLEYTITDISAYINSISPASRDEDA